jgi:two-component system, chemotaxis family, protein-glutamate methylesterase/glutaminase
MKPPVKRIRVLVVDDSALARRAISDALARDPEIEVVGSASDPYVARDKIIALQPDVITLDLEMPRMDGLTFLKILQEHHPVPVVVVSSLTQAGSAKAMEALEAGALDVLGKPDGSRSFAQMAHQLAYHVKAAGRSRRKLGRVQKVAKPVKVVKPTAPSIAPGDFSSRRIIVIGSSTGGVEALRFLLPRLPAGLPPIVVVQHIPPNFSRIMAEHLDELCPYTVREAVDGEELRPGLCLIAPGDFHLVLARAGLGYRVRLTQSPPVHHCRPSVDILFRSAAEQAGHHAVAALLTGMGVDGAHGLKLLRTAGSRTLAEDEESCVVFGMPQAAINLGAAEQIVPLPRMPQAILNALAQPLIKP